jgi:hypothetical protein
MHKSVPSQKPTARATLFQHQHLVNYGLKAMQIDVATGAVSSVRCQFCVYIGKEDTITDGKRKRTQTDRVKDWNPPFRPELYESHHKGQHPTHWTEYQKLDYDQKTKYFDHKIKQKDTLYGHFKQAAKTHII